MCKTMGGKLVEIESAAENAYLTLNVDRLKRTCPLFNVHLYLSVCVFICWLVYLLVCPFVCLSIRLYDRLFFVCLFIYSFLSFFSFVRPFFFFLSLPVGFSLSHFY